MIRVERSWDDDGASSHPEKEGRKRNVPLTGALRDALTEHRIITSAVLGAGVRHHPGRAVPKRQASGGAPAPTGNARGSAIGLHECRHTFASLMIAAGVNAKSLSAYLGHASITTTFDLYGHLMPGNEAEAAELVDSYLAKATTNSALARSG